MSNRESEKRRIEETAKRYISTEQGAIVSEGEAESPSDPYFVNRMLKCAERAGSVNALARKADLSQSGIRRYFTGGEPTRKVLISIAHAAAVNFLWLATGEGPMLPEEAAASALTTQKPDPKMLRLAIETVEEALLNSGRTMLPERKAELVSAVFELFLGGEGKIEKSAVLRLVKSAS